MDISQVIEDCINNHKPINMTIRYSYGDAGDLDFHPYIMGNDLFQHPFVWGHLPYRKGIYKFRLSDIIKINKVSDSEFSIDPKAIYYYSAEEEHFAIAPKLEAKRPIYFEGHDVIDYDN